MLIHLGSYIRDLISGLSNSEDYDIHQLALSTAPSLIRRKADFGSEAKDRCEEIGGLLISLHNTFGVANFEGLRREGMMAVLIAQPLRMGPFYASIFFRGDYSLSQRAAILTVLAMGARELAGHADTKPSADFASMKLPDRLHRTYADSIQIDVLSRQVQQNLMLSKTSKKAPRTVRNGFTKVVAECFFFPLLGQWQMIAHTRHALYNVVSRYAELICEIANQSTHFVRRHSYQDLLRPLQSLCRQQDLSRRPCHK